MEEKILKAGCLDCEKEIEPEAEVDIQLCEKCMENYDVDRLWKMHDNKELDALDFNESEEMRKKFRKLED